jgi:uncharacterized RDD family membrane protein YckC
MESSEYNPYAAPRSQVSDVEATEQQQLATKLQRLGNVLIDSLAFAIVMFTLLVGSRVLDAPLLREMTTDRLLVLLLVTFYYALSEFFSGVTLGKLLTGTRVVTEAGGAPGFQQLLVRSVARLVPLESLSFLGAPPVGWHDRWSRTRVIRTRRNPALDRTYDLHHGSRSSRGAWQPELER